MKTTTTRFCDTIPFPNGLVKKEDLENLNKTMIDYSRIYPSAHCREFALQMKNKSRRTKAYKPLTDKLSQYLSIADIAKLLCLDYHRITRGTKTRIVNKIDDLYYYAENQYCLPYELADMIDEFEQSFFTTSTPIEKEEYKCKKLNEKPRIDDIEEEIEEDINEIFEEENSIMKEEFDQVFKSLEVPEERNQILPVIIPEGYLSDMAYDVFYKYMDCIGRKFIQKDDTKVSVKRIFDLAVSLSKLSSEDTYKLKSLIIPIERNYITDEEYIISDIL